MNILARCVCCFAAVLLLGAPAVAQISLTEILADPVIDWDGDGTPNYRGDEWVEVTNVGAEAVDLVHYYIRDGLGEDPHVNLFGVLPPGEAAVFYGSNAVAFQQEAGFSVSGLSLNNSGDTVELLYMDPITEEISVLESYTYDDHTVVDDRAVALFIETGEWGVADALNPYGGDTAPLGTGCPPSPGEVNSCVPNVPNESTQWGQIKVLYR